MKLWHDEQGIKITESSGTLWNFTSAKVNAGWGGSGTEWIGTRGGCLVRGAGGSRPPDEISPELRETAAGVDEARQRG